MLFKKTLFALPFILFSQSALALTLQEAMHSTLSENPTLRAQQQLTQQAKEQSGIDFGFLLPEITGEASAVLEGRRTFSGGGQANNIPKTLAVRARQNLFSGGENVARLLKSERLYDSSAATLRQTEQNTLLQAAEAYLNVMLNSRILELNTFQVDVLNKQLDATNARFELGEVTKTDVSQSQARLAAARAAAVASKGQYITSKAIFREVVGVEATDLSWPEALNFAAPNDIEQALEHVLEKHPQALAAQKNLEAEKHTITQARSNFMPDIFAEVRAARIEDGTTFQGNGSINETSVTINAEFPLFRGGRTVGAINQAVAAKREASENYNAARRLVQRELVDAFNNYQTVRAELLSRKEATRANLVAYEGVKQEALLGARTTLDLLDAEEELLQARVDEVTAKHGKILSTFRLLAAMGQLTGDQIAVLFPKAEAGSAEGENKE